jgi:hypothetical protein
MEAKFDRKDWDNIARKLKQKFPQLTDADLVWRHETKAGFYKIIAAGLGISRFEFEQIIAQLQQPTF